MQKCTDGDRMDRVPEKKIKDYYKIYEQIYEDPTISLIELSNKTKMSRNTISKYLHEMYEKKVLVGPYLDMKSCFNYMEYVYLMNFSDPFFTFKGLRDFPHVVYGVGPLQRIVITDHTTFHETRNYLGLEGIEQEIIDDFLLKNADSHPLHDFFNLDIPVVLLSKEEMEKIFSPGVHEGWHDFYGQYPYSQGIMELSRVGFNAEMDKALVYVGNQVDGLWGAGYIHLLVKVNGVWIIQDTEGVWIS